MDVRANITAYCATVPILGAAVLFGSAATHRLRADSDIDLALLFGIIWAILRSTTTRFLRTYSM